MPQGKLNSPSMRYITQLRGGWLVQAGASSGKRGGAVVAKSFYHSTLGSKAKSLKAARLYRDNEMKRLGLDLQNKLAGSRGQQWGGGYCRQYDRRRDVYYWSVYWQTENGQRKKTFSEARYGSEKAERLAHDHAKIMRQR